MPLPIIAGATLLGGALNNRANAQQNEASRKFEKEQYDRQRRDNLEDWNRNNAYNDPSAQMKRLKAGGLNPNLVYGQSSGGASGQASPIKSSSSGSPQFNASNFDAIPKSISDHYDTQVKQAQIDNIKSQNTVNVETAALTKAKTLQTLVGTESGKFNLSIDKQFSADAQKEKLRQLIAQTSLTDQTRRNKNIAFGQEFKQRELNIKGSISENKIKKFKSEMAKLGITPSSNIWTQLMTMISTNSPK